VDDRRLAWFVIGWVGGIATAAVIALTIVLAVAWERDEPDEDRSPSRVAIATEVTGSLRGRPLGAVPRDLPRATLTVHDDGCGVIRSDVPPGIENLTWHIEDEDGFQVLGRNAEGETRYRYFRPGTYTVVLEAYDGRASVPISNTVTITC
jgi:hypothetical protein